ncbi:putative F420-dependent oxidoreductase [Amycolatopsis bartoniae]|nr:putative F420-dependent oxidoreductase [Amycolatopsis bartoniae]
MTVPFDAPLEAHRGLYRALADAGYTDVWSIESAGTDAFTPLVLAAAWEPRLNVGTGVASVFTRGPGLLAQTAAALAEAAPGRATIGVGVSSAVFVERWNSVPYVKPYQRARDVLRVLRSALAGERTDLDGETLQVRGIRLGRKPAAAPPVVLAALREGMIRLAARHADGVMTNWVSPADVRQVVQTYRDAGGSGTVVDRIMVCPNPDAELVRTSVKPLIARYLSVPGYAEFQRWLGHADQLEPVWRAWHDGRRDEAAAAVPDELVDGLVVHGTPEQCREGLRQYREAGVTLPVVSIMPFGVDAFEGALALAGR